jgi:hypothetical protein
MKFSIRDLLVVTVIVAVCLAWGIECYRHSITHQKLLSLHSAVMSEGYAVETTTQYTGPLQSGFSTRLVLPNSSAPAPNPPKD